MRADRLFLFLGALSAAIAVAAGALGAHALQSALEPQRLAAFETAARYQMYHALAMCAAAWAIGRFQGRAATLAGFLFTLGTLLFSGGLYLYSLAGLRAAAMVAPVGGAAFIAGWLCLAWVALVAARHPH
ncbi:MAG: DUF423 domain-containing protein [Burkholderiaceae bacterium]|nr:DUF423 domain-containing protein [Burkholderiaceae bacterium]